MKLLEFVGVKGLPVWVSAGQVAYVSRPDNAGEGASMYGGNNANTSTRIWFSAGSHLDVREALEDVVARFNA
ncbi:MAG: hypothetical protein ACHP7N_00530 [Caulobacterales bacterium]